MSRTVPQLLRHSGFSESIRNGAGLSKHCSQRQSLLRVPQIAARRALFSTSTRFAAGAAVGTESHSISLGGESIPSIWLRDHCQCPQCVHPETAQRLLDTSSIPRDIKSTTQDLTHHEVKINWSDGHQSSYDLRWLKSNIPFQKSTKSPDLNALPQGKVWAPKGDYPKVACEQVMTASDGLEGLLENIAVKGFSFIDGCEETPEATEKLLERIGPIRNTHYGAFWDFTSNLASKDTAYTTIALGVHNDNTYFTDPAGLQLFHLLEHSGGSGGESTLVDGFQAATILRKENPEYYDILSRVLIPTHASGNEDAHFAPEAAPVFNHNARTRELEQIRWNNDDRAPKTDWKSEEELLLWYDASRKWAEILKRDELVQFFQLVPGSPMIFDNWRMLHGRTVFDGKRRLCGGYINFDDWRARHKAIRKAKKS